MLIQPSGEPATPSDSGAQAPGPHTGPRFSGGAVGMPARPIDGWGFAGDQGNTIDLTAYWRILMKRRWLILSVIIAALLGGIAATLLTQPLFTSQATLQIDREAARVLANDSDAAPRESMMSGEEFFQTQYGLLRSRSLAIRVAEQSGLARDDRFIILMGARPPPADLAPAQRAIRRRDAVASLISRALTVTPTRGSRLVAVSITAASCGR